MVSSSLYDDVLARYFPTDETLSQLDEERVCRVLIRIKKHFEEKENDDGSTQEQRRATDNEQWTE